MRIFTNQWHEQDGSLIYENGDFNCTAYINKQKPPARLELTVVSAEGIDLVQRYADLA
jgi:hypothetical protein